MKKNIFILLAIFWLSLFSFFPLLFVSAVKSVDFIGTVYYYVFALPISFSLLLMYYLFFWKKKNGSIKYFLVAYSIFFLIVCSVIIYWLGGVLGRAAYIAPIF